MADCKLWVFGYGSLLWNPGFDFSRSCVGSVRGYVRRFWQGNTAQRGTEQQPGRVVTLIEDAEGTTWGRAYQLSDADRTFSYLEQREARLGGYRTSIVQFQAKDTSVAPFPVLVYVATSDSRSYLGPAPLPTLAADIVSARGSCGHNVEYVVRLADFMRQHLPEVSDEHLYTLEQHVRTTIRESNLCLEDLMGPDYEEPGPFRLPPEEEEETPPPHATPAPLHASRITAKKLRCVNV